MKNLIILFTFGIYMGITWSQSLVAYYPFNGNADDISGNNLHLTAFGLPLDTLDRFGLEDHSFYFNGSTDYFYHINDPLLTPTDALSINVWVKNDSIDGESDVVVSTLDVPAVGGYQIDISKLTPTQHVISWDLYPLSGRKVIRTPYDSQLKGQWIMITGTFDSTGSKLYINGVLKQSLSFTDSLYYLISNNFRIGTNPHANNQNRRFKGFIDDVRIYNRSLTLSEINSLFVEFTPVSEDEQNIVSPTTFELFQNYPNPFNPSTSIKYSIISRSFVTIKIYNVLGNEIATLVNEEKSPGNYELKFEAKNISSGIYFYRLSADNQEQTKKMVLLK